MGMVVESEVNIDTQKLNSRFLETMKDEEVNTVRMVTGLAYSTVNNMRNGYYTCSPSMQPVYRAAKHYHVPLCYLMGLVDEMPVYEYTEREYDADRFGRRLDACIRKHFTTLKEAARKCGTKENTLRNWILGEANYPNIYIIYRICYVTRVSPDWLMGLIDHK